MQSLQGSEVVVLNLFEALWACPSFLANDLSFNAGPNCPPGDVVSPAVPQDWTSPVEHCPSTVMSDLLIKGSSELDLSEEALHEIATKLQERIRHPTAKVSYKAGLTPASSQPRPSLDLGAADGHT